ncbi:50S ribosomal protein L13 [Candidatus Campbellbacteria bacterium CG22_combo_CG10-13_8_21_14_all_36_13]|uniref:50S ribosomal protein L13 n=1 Tax=Candidatus Campbellbacteria bacterium CG22_combo_CG10-13_8_21_14_all_36_13 TaxID=1974529 RepID=A0A2H0DYL4_9BACT|nr:MAG: 50S ribosomal protein L13 [Candidatus Campbellbacteria bacterium CG22_combo_CG10-13_8_21_14_all_36_13]
METAKKTKEYTIDAKGRKLGRLATEIAVLLIGKNEPNFKTNVLPDVNVFVTNVDLMDIDDKKASTKKYYRYSGYPGGQKAETLAQVRDKKGTGEVLKTAVYGMLPINKLRKERMKKLIIK